MAKNEVSRISAPAKPVRLPPMSEKVRQQFKLARLENESRRMPVPEMRGLSEEEYQRIMAMNRPGGSLASYLTSKLPTSAARDAARVVTHGLGQTGVTLLKFLDTPSRLFGNRSKLRDIYEAAERGMAYDEFEDQSGVPQVAATAVHLASAGVMGRALPAVFGTNVGMDTYEIAKATGASEGEALAKGVGHGVVDTAIWTLGQGLASKYLPKAWQWLGREIVGAGRGAASSVTSDAVLNSLGADISGEEMARHAVHAAWMVPLLGMLKMGGKRREEAMSLLRKARPDLAGERVDKVIETIEAEFSDPKSQKVALAWVARKGANLPDDTAQIKQALEVSSKVKGLDPMSRSPFEILSNPAYARYLPKPRPQDVKAFSNMKRYPMGVIGFDVSDDAAGRQATREMINAYMSPSSNPWCLATGKDATKLGELGPSAEGYWKQHSAVPKQIFFQEVDGKLELTAFRATAVGGEGRQEYWDTSDAGYSGIPIKVKVPGDPMGRYRKMVFRPTNPAGDGIRVSQGPHPWTYRDEADLERHIEEDRSMLARYEAGSANDPYRDIRIRSFREDIDAQEQTLRAYREAKSGNNEVQGTFEDIAPGKIFKGDPFRDGRTQTWVFLEEQQKSDGTGVGIGHSVSRIDGPIDIVVGREGGQFPTIEAARAELQRVDSRPLLNDFEAPPDEIAEDREYYGTYRQALVQAIEGAVRNSRPVESSGRTPQYVLVEDKVRTTENGITKFRTTKYADPTDWDYEPPKPGEAPKPVEIEESELVSPEWMRARGYDPESESDVRRMQQDLDLQAWGNGMEAAMAVVPTRRTFMQTKSGTPETVTYGPNGRDVVSVDFEKDGVPYRKEYFATSDRLKKSHAYDLGEIVVDGLPGPADVDVAFRFSAPPPLYRLTRDPGGSPRVVDEVKWDEGLRSFVRTSGNRRWRMTVLPEVQEGLDLRSHWEDAQRSYQEASDRFFRHHDDASLELMYDQATAVLNAAWREYRIWVKHHPHLIDQYGAPSRSSYTRLLIEDRQPDGTWAPAVGPDVQASLSRVNALRRPSTDESDEIPMYIQMGLDDEALDQEARYDEAMERALAEEPDAPDMQTQQDLELDDVPFALKAGRTRRNVRAAEGGGDTPGAPLGAPVPTGPASASAGPRIVINPQVFKDKRDALCVAFNEAFRLVMEENGFEPVSEPTEKQRKFFSDTAYSGDELQLRRTILARIATLDTSVSDPTDEQLEETAEMLEMVMEVGAPQNEWEQSAVQRLHDVIVKARETSAARSSPLPPKQ